MPIYEYECKNCSTRFEKLQSITAEPLSECVNCGSGPIRRVLHPVGVIFKGSGWYINDSRTSGRSGGSGGADGSEGGSAKSEAGSDSGTSAKGESASTKSESATTSSE